MPSAPLPIDEARRLATLRACQVLDTAPERAFDELVALAVQLSAVPIAVISLVDESRQWFKARIGLDVCETPRAQAFCAYAILEPKPLIVEDATQDARFSDNPLVTGEPGIRFYAGFPLQVDDGLRLGTLCVIDTRPRQLAAGQVTALQALAHQACAQLELRRALLDLRALREREQQSADRSLEARATQSFRIGQLLHKGLAEELSEIAAVLKAGLSTARTLSPALRQALVHAGDRVAEAASDCRAVAARFRDFSLLSLGWLAAVRADIERLEVEHEVCIVLEEGEDPDQLLEYAAAHRLAEFVHAGLTTAIGQWGARTLSIAVTRRGGSLLLTLRHDGTRNGGMAVALHPASRLRVLAAELGSVMHESPGERATELRLSLNLSSPPQGMAEPAPVRL